MQNKFKILFLCTGNSCRSQMAEGFARHLKGDTIEPYSAGILPGVIDSRAIQVMKEAGIDISKQRSKHVDELQEKTFDYVITLCDYANEVCPILPGRAVHIHKGFEDPPTLSVTALSEEEALNHYRRVRDEIRKYIEQLPDILPKKNTSAKE